MATIKDKAKLIFKTFKQKIGVLDIDILDSINISESKDITSHPVDNKYSTDHYISNPTEISMSFRISKFSLRNSKISQIKKLASGDIPDRLLEAHDELYRLYEDEEPITVLSTKYKEYGNMVITSLNIIRDSNDGEVLKVSVTLKKVNIVYSKLTQLDNSVIKTDSAKAKSNFERQTGAAKELEPKSKLTLTQFVKSIFSK